jgi:anti-sigma B factor antagonist
VSSEFSFTARDLPGVHVVTLCGELDIVSSYDLALALVEVAGSTVVVDLSGLTFMDSSGISALVMAKNRIQADGRGQLLLTEARGIVREALEIVGLSSWIVDWSADWDE